jgi:hypothetical protein
MVPRRSWVKADNPFWPNHIAAWYRSALDAEHYCRKHDLSTASLMRWARHLLSADDLRKHAEHMQKSHRKTSGRQPKNGQSKAEEASAQSLQRADAQRSGGSSGVLGHAYRSDELERHGARRVRRSTGVVAACVADLARSAGTIRQRNGLAEPASSECPGSIKQRC